MLETNFTMTFEQIVTQIEKVHIEMQRYAVRQVDNALTMRNIITGYYIVDFEQNGLDRATYGANTIKLLAKRLKHIKGISAPQLYRFREFYLIYPQIFSTVSRKLQQVDLLTETIFSTPSGKLEMSIHQDSDNTLSYDADTLLNRLSFSHFIELLKAETPLKRSFYEVQTIKNNWSVRELARAMNTLLYERTGLSSDKQLVADSFKKDSINPIKNIVRNPYFLEFIGLEEKASYTEQEFETALINHLQAFLTELGRGFCFEARQKRISFDNKHYRIDLVFYHRVLKCHVLIDLKIGLFDHADAGQMNMYLNYYKANEMTEGDNPPVGIILCASHNQSLVEYATAGLSNEVFVSKYLVQLPSKEMLEDFIKNEIETTKI